VFRCVSYPYLSYPVLFYCIVRYHTVLYCTVLYCTVLCCTVLCCAVPYCTVLYCTVIFIVMSYLCKLIWSLYCIYQSHDVCNFIFTLTFTYECRRLFSSYREHLYFNLYTCSFYFSLILFFVTSIFSLLSFF
jgi:hypothetical protein